MSIKVTAENVKLVMWKRREMDARKWDADKKEWQKTGEREERTEYTFRDEFGDIVVLLGKDTYREMEGQECDVTFAIQYNEFQRKNSMTLDSCVLSN